MRVGTDQIESALLEIQVGMREQTFSVYDDIFTVQKLEDCSSYDSSAFSETEGDVEGNYKTPLGPEQGQKGNWGNLLEAMPKSCQSGNCWHCVK